MKTSGWMITDAVNWVSCPKCGSRPGHGCQTPKGRKVNCHGERVQALISSPLYNEKNYMHVEAKSFTEWVKSRGYPLSTEG